MFIVYPLEAANLDITILEKIGFTDVIVVNKQNIEEGLQYEFDEMFFFSIFCSNSDYLKRLNKKKLILAYEGITTFQLNNWSNGDVLKRFDLHHDIDEIWLPCEELLLDKEYLPKCRIFSLDLSIINRSKLEEICYYLNALFRYNYSPLNCNTIFMDRYLTKYLSLLLNVGTERILTHVVFYGIKGDIAIKRHPSDTNYKTKFEGLKGAMVIDENVPWELMYLNNKLYNTKKSISKYIVYNSFGPANIALLFNDVDFEIVCVEPLLDKYADLSSTYLNSDVTYQILKRFSEIYDVGVRFVERIEDLSEEQEGFGIEDELWRLAEARLRSMGKDNRLETNAFRLQLDCALNSLKRKYGTYYINANNSSASISRVLLQAALPNFEEVFQMAEADILVDCDGNMVNYVKQVPNVNQLKIVEGCYRLSGMEAEIEKLLIGIENIYIWGASNTNNKTFDILNKLEFESKIRCVFDSYATGLSHNLPIVPFEKSIVEKNSYIFVCANLAYPEIFKILKKAGFSENIEFGLGVGISQNE